MDKQLFVERILETENLTDELDDSDANWLLDWGIGRLDQVLQGATDEDSAGERVNALMAVMRKMNRIVGSYTGKSTPDLAEDLAALDGLFAQAFGRAVGNEPSKGYEQAAENVAKLPTRQALEYLAGDPFSAADPPAKKVSLASRLKKFTSKITHDR